MTTSWSVPCKHRVLRAPLEQQVRIEDSHAAIVTPEEFAQAQRSLCCSMEIIRQGTTQNASIR